MKARVRVAVMLSALGLLLALGAMAVRVMWRQSQAQLAQQALDLLPDVAQRIQDFHRVHVRDGQKVWEIAAKEARYFDEEKKVVVRDPLLELFLRDGRSVGLRGHEATIRLDEKDLDSVDLTGDIRVSLADYTVTTDAAHYDRESDMIRTAGPVRISGVDLDAQGGRMEVEVGEQRLRLSGDVVMTLRARANEGDVQP